MAVNKLQAQIVLYITIIIAASFMACSTTRPKYTKEARKYSRICADSINRLTDDPGQTIPYFLSEHCMDYNKHYWKDIHHPVPLRRLIVEKVNNVSAINFLITHYHEQLQIKCPFRQTKNPKGLVYYTMPDEDVSFLELLEQRLRVLMRN